LGDQRLGRYGRFVGVLCRFGGDDADLGVAVGKIPMTSVRRQLSVFR